MIKVSTFRDIVAALMAIAFAASISYGAFGTGLDTDNYFRIFGDIHNQVGLWALRYEPLFVLYIKTFTSPDTNSYFTYFLVIAPAILAKVVSARRIGGHSLVFLLVYGSLWASTFELNQIRLALALGVFFLSISLYGKGIYLATALASVTIGFHYSMVSFIPVLWLVVLWRSNISPFRKFPLIIFIAVLGYFSISFLMIKFIPYLDSMMEIRSSEGARLFSLFAIYDVLCTITLAVFVLGLGLKYTPIPILVAVISAIVGIVWFFFQASSGGAYAYRILETMTALLPLAISWAWSNTKSRRWRIVFLAIIVCSLAMAPRYWESRIA